MAKEQEGEPQQFVDLVGGSPAKPAEPPPAEDLAGGPRKAPPAPVPPPPPPPEPKPAKQAAAPEARKPAPAQASGPKTLQQRFEELLAAKPPAKGLFGMSAPKQNPEEDALSNNTVQMILEEAARLGSSDVHVEPLDDMQRVRMRIDGALELALQIPRTLNVRILPRLRELCGLEREKTGGPPEEGRMEAVGGNSEVEIRLSTYPTLHGERAVVRLIDRRQEPLSWERLALWTESAASLQWLIQRPQGLIVVAGPSGSGRSTTLYTLLQALNAPGRSILTLEDPIERPLRGISQSAVDARAGFTFLEGLKAALRQDPSVIMISELPDRETAETALKAAMTGQMVLTALRASAAAGAVSRLLDMGLDAFLVSSALTAVLSQRLVRRICERCREARSLAPQTVQSLEELCRRSGITPQAARLPMSYAGRGCEQCRQTGYRCRILLSEILRLSPDLRALVMRKAPASELQAQALKEGMQIMLFDGLRKAVEGLTSVEELLRTAAVPD